MDSLGARRGADGQVQFLHGLREAAIPAGVGVDHAEREFALLFLEGRAAGSEAGQQRNAEDDAQESGAG